MLSHVPVRSLVPRAALAAIAFSAFVYAACADESPEATDGTTPDGGTTSSGGPVPTGVVPLDAAPACTDEGKAVDCTLDGGVAPDLRCTGLYACWSPKSVAPTALLYRPGAELWSDGAEKSRYVSLPVGTKVDATDPSAWVFPVGTKVWKEFKVGGKRIETRYFEKFATGTGPSSWHMTTYRWSDDGESSSTRFETGAMVGDYEIPATNRCVQCHQGSHDQLLGFEPWSMSIPSAVGMTTTKLKELGLVDPAPAVPTLAIPEDATGKAALALGWLHANCGSCHNDRTGVAKTTGLYLDLGVDLTITDVKTTHAFKTAVGVNIARAKWSTQYPGFQRITAGDASKSLIPTIAELRDADGGVDTYQMPPLLVRKVDPKIASVRDWVNAL